MSETATTQPRAPRTARLTFGGALRARSGVIGWGGVFTT